MRGHYVARGIHSFSVEEAQPVTDRWIQLRLTEALTSLPPLHTPRTLMRSCHKHSTRVKLRMRIGEFSYSHSFAPIVFEARKLMVNVTEVAQK